jgi:hypothetical protein
MYQTRCILFVTDKDKFQNNIKVTIERLSMKENHLGIDKQEPGAPGLQAESIDTIDHSETSSERREEGISTSTNTNTS